MIGWLKMLRGTQIFSNFLLRLLSILKKRIKNLVNKHRAV
jgi:hypothetical protein